ncbi:glycosyltransferase family 2 protein [Flavobacteriaceae sp. LMIT009]
MNFYIVIPAHNEVDSILLTLESLVNQTLSPKKILVVNDNSTDDTEKLVSAFASKHANIALVNNQSSEEHLPGTKIINAFYKGYEVLDEDYDVICKFDADLVFPSNYLEVLTNHFKQDQQVGMAAGFCYIKKNEEWVIEDLTNKDHIRGALKAYRKNCFLQIGMLKRSMGWDTIDELLAQFYDWKIVTDESLHVKHLKPTGLNYAKGSKFLQGEALYKLRFGFPLAFLSSLKLAYKKRSLKLFFNYIIGYIRAVFSKTERLITKEQGKFIRNYRWKKILKKVF